MSKTISYDTKNHITYVTCFCKKCDMVYVLPGIIATIHQKFISISTIICCHITQNRLTTFAKKEPWRKPRLFSVVYCGYSKVDIDYSKIDIDYSKVDIDYSLKSPPLMTCFGSAFCASGTPSLACFWIARIFIGRLKRLMNPSASSWL